jgi:hypothetical protein
VIDVVIDERQAMSLSKAAFKGRRRGVVRNIITSGLLKADGG